MREIFNNLKSKSSIVHCITNYVTVNDLANIILSSGASPIMADDKEEVKEIVAIASSLVINIGTLNSRTVDSMILAGKRANELNIPVILDPVGVGASEFRQRTTEKLLEEIKFSVIKGNASEIKFLYNKELSKSGVDASIEDIINHSNIDDYISMGKDISRKYNSIIAITGPIDIITDGSESYIVENGNSYMEKITGAGCMLGGLIGGVVGSNPEMVLESVVLGIIIMGLAGDYAKKYIDDNNLGTSSFRTSLIDNIGLIKYENIEEDGKFEKR